MGNENPDVFHFEFSPHCPYLTRINPNSPLNNIVNLRTDCVDLDTDYGTQNLNINFCLRYFLRIPIYYKLYLIFYQLQNEQEVM